MSHQPDGSNESVIHLEARAADMERQARIAKQTVDRMRKDLEDEGTRVKAFGRECHALLCLDPNCAGFSDHHVEAEWTKFAHVMLERSPLRSDHLQLLRLIASIRESPFFRTLLQSEALPA